MKSLRALAIAVAVLSLSPASTFAQYMRISTDNPADNTRLRPTGTTVLTITLDTNHDRNGTLQTCNSHSLNSGCGGLTTAQPLDMFSYTLALKAVGGTVTWGTFTPADAAYTDTSPQIQSDTEVEINKALPAASVTPAGLSTLGTISVTPATGNASIAVQVGASNINPFGFGTAFDTSCDGYVFPNTYVLGDPADPCGTVTGIPGDWFDWAVALPDTGNTPPVLTQPSNMTVNEGSTGNQTLTATDADGDALSFSKESGPSFATVTTTTPGTGTATGNIQLAPGFIDSGSYSVTVIASDGTANDSKSFSAVVPNINRAPVLSPVNDMTVTEGATADQLITGSDADADPLAFFKNVGPGFMAVSTITPTTGNIHLAPGLGDAGSYGASVSATDGSLLSTRTLSIVVNTGANQVPVLAQPSDMTANEGATADQTLTASDPDGDPLTFSKVAGPAFMTVATTTSGTGIGSGIVHIAPGFADAGVYGATVRASDASTSSDRSFTITVNNVNRPPVLDTVSNMTTEEGVTADQVIKGSDPDGDSLTFEKFSGPAFMSVLNTNATSGFIHLFPPLGTTGTFSAGVSAVDPSNASRTQGFQITVTARTGNRPPNLVQPIDLTMNEGEVADQSISATDPDETPLTFALVSGPTFMNLTTLNAVHANVHIAPWFMDAGTHVATVEASDGSLNDRKSFTTYVLNHDLAPGELFGITQVASDSAVVFRIDPSNGFIDARRIFRLSSNAHIGGFAFHTPTGHFVAVQSDAGGPSTLLEFDLQPGLVSEHAITGLPIGEQFAQGVEYQDAQHRLLVTFAPTGTFAQRRIAEIDITGQVLRTSPALPLADLDYVVEAPDGRLFGFDPNDPPTVSQLDDIFGSPSVTTLSNLPANQNLSDPAFSSTDVLFTTDAVTGSFYTVDPGAYSLRGNLGPNVAGLAFVTNASNVAHVLAQPADMTVREGETQDQTLTTTDANTDPLVFTKVDGPPFMTVSTAISDTGMTTGNVHLAPGFFDAGLFQATVRVTDGALSDDKSFSIVVTNASPVVTSPEFATVEEEAELSVTVTASDPDGDPITLTADRSALPAENDATFTTNGSHTQGTLVWHPVTGDIGTYPVAFIAVAPDTGRSVTRIRVVPQGTKAVGDLAWTPAAPDTGVYTVTFTAVDGDGEVGTAQTIVTVLPASSARIANPPRVHYAPDRSQRGPIISVIGSVTLTAGQSLLITASAVDPDRGPIISFTEEITGPSIPANPPTFTVSRDPQVTVPQNIDGTDGAPIDFEVSAGDPDGEPILSLSADLSDIPTTNPAQFTTTANNALGHFHWVPQPVDVRDQAYRVAFTASNALTVTDTTRIAIRSRNHAPVASAGGPYSTFVNLPLELNGTGSSDPDGDALLYLWRFGDGASGLGATPSHTYKNAGDYSAVLTVTDIVPQAALADSESTMVHIRAVLQASAFTLGADKIIKLKSGKPTSCVQIEPAEPGFSVSEIDLFSIVLRSEGTGAVAEIHAVPRKLGLVQDANRNGVLDVSACFQKADLRALFANVSGTQQIPVEVRGRIASGAPFSASLMLTVSGTSGGLAAAVDPNPLNPAAAFTFELTRAGVVRIQIFDSAGRLVRDVIAGKYFQPGLHEVQLDARDRSGRPLASGVYFYRLQAPEGNVTGRFAVLK